MSVKILIKRTSVPGRVPEPEELEEGELFLNTADGRLFTKKADNTVVDITGTSLSSLPTSTMDRPYYAYTPTSVSGSGQLVSSFPENNLTPSSGQSMMSNSQLIGRGWSFPPQFTPAGPVMSEGADEIRQALTLLMATELGERAMRPDFGSSLRDYLYMAVDADSLAALRESVSNSLVNGESRIDLERVDVDTSQAGEGVLLIKVDYTIRETNTRDNLVYPFYLIEVG